MTARDFHKKKIEAFTRKIQLAFCAFLTIFFSTGCIQHDPEPVRVGILHSLSGTMADHGMTILTQREGLTFDSAIQSDSAPLNQMVKKILTASEKVHVLRDPTRGGVGTTLNEIAESCFH